MDKGAQRGAQGTDGAYREMFDSPSRALRIACDRAERRETCICCWDWVMISYKRVAKISWTNPCEVVEIMIDRASYREALECNEAS